MRVNYLKISISVLLAIFMTGCWDASEIQEYTIVTSLTVDYKDNLYSFHCETPFVLGGLGEGNKLEFEIIKSKGETFTSARDALERSTNLPVLLSSTRVVVFTERLCTHGIEEYMNRIRGEFDYRKSVLLATTMEEPEKLMTMKPKNIPSIGAAMENVIRSNETIGNSFEMSVGEVLEYIAVKNAGFLIPQIDVAENQFALTGYCVMKHDKCIGHIHAEERIGTICLIVKNNKFEYDLNFNNTSFILHIEMKKQKIKPYIINGEIYFDINLSYKATILYADAMTNLKKDQIKAMAKALEEEFRNHVYNALDMAQNKFKCDYLDFFKYFRAKYQKQYKKIEDWNEAFSKARMNVNVNVDIIGTSMITVEKD